MRGAAERGHLVLGLGDFNMLPSSLAHRLITTHAPVRDVWRVLHPDSSIGAAEDPVEKARRRPIPTADFNLIENGVTCDSVYNTWRWNKGQQKKLGPDRPHVEIAGDTIDPQAKRLDYIFASTGLQDDDAVPTWIVQSVKVGMTERHPVLQCSVSDHFSVEATLIRRLEPLSQDPQKTEDAAANGVFLQSPTNSNHRSSRYDEQTSSAVTENASLPVSTYDEILTMVSIYKERENKQRRFRLYHFLGQLAIAIGCFFAIWWSPRNFVAFLLMLLSTLGLSAGVVDGLIGGLFMGSEIRALKEFEWEIRNVREAAGGGSNGQNEIEGAKQW
jgi:sphingomyelin phosphodiesterase 2